MELRHLRYFLAVAEELHFGRAAERLRISQPPLSATIQALERELGVRLFLRTTRQVSLTPEGEHLRDRIRPVLAEIEHIASELAEVRTGVRGRLRVGYVSSASYSVLPGAVRRFQQAMPLVDLRLSPLTSGEQTEQLLSGDLDLAILRDHRATPEIEQQRVRSEGLVVVLPEWHALAELETVPPDALGDEPLILFSGELMPGYVSLIMSALRTGGSRPNIVQRAVHQETVLGMVAAGIGLSILPESVARVRMPGVTARPLLGGTETELQLAWHTAPGPAARVFTECTLEAARTG